MLKSQGLFHYEVLFYYPKLIHLLKKYNFKIYPLSEFYLLKFNEAQDELLKKYMKEIEAILQYIIWSYTNLNDLQNY